MIDRYSREVMKKIWSPENRFKTWLQIEISACEALCKLGQVPEAALKNIKELCLGIDAKVTDDGIAAFRSALPNRKITRVSRETEEEGQFAPGSAKPSP